MSTIPLRFLAVVLGATMIAGCTSSTQQPKTPGTTPTSTAPAPGFASARACSAAQGRVVPSHAPFTLGHRLVQPFGYVNLGAACLGGGFPVVGLYDGAHHPLNFRQIDGNIVLGTAKPAQILLKRDDQSVGFNIETSTTGPCVTARYITVSFGGGITPPASIDYQLCGRVYVTTIFR